MACLPTINNKRFESLEDLYNQSSPHRDLAFRLYQEFLEKNTDPSLNVKDKASLKEALNKAFPGENISSASTGLASLLTNLGNSIEVSYKGRNFRNAEHAYQTWKSGFFDEAAYNSTERKPIGVLKADKNTNLKTMVEIITAKLRQNPDLIEGILLKGGITYLNNSTHNVTGRDTFWETAGGQDKFIEALSDAFERVMSDSIRNLVRGIKVNQFEYSLDLETGEVIHNSKTKGDVIEENETQINKVYVAFAKDTNYPTRSFNNQEYVHIFGKILNMKTGSEVTQKQIVDLFAAPKKSSKTEVKTGSTVSTFTYKGKTIATDFQFTEEQTRALEKLIDFSTNGKRAGEITLSGYAGTGKTSMIKYLERYLGRGNNFVYAAPTHAATVYLGVNLGLLPLTVPSLFNVEKNPSTGLERYAPSFKFKNKLKSLQDNILVIDEGSMVTRGQLQALRSAVGTQVKIIYMGDKAQLPEIVVTPKGQPIQPKEISPIFTEVENIQLTEVKRTEDDGILAILTELRNNPDGLIPISEGSDTLAFFNDKMEFERAAFKAIQEDPEGTIYISYTNNTVKAFNRDVREGLGYGQDLEVGESIIGYIGYGGKSVEDQNLANSVKYTVTSVNVKNDGKVDIGFSSEILESIPELKEKGKTKGNTTYLQLSKSDSLTFEAITESQMEANNQIISQYMRDVHEAKQRAKKYGGWRDYYELVRQTQKSLATYELGGNYLYNPRTDRMEVSNFSQEHMDIKRYSAELEVKEGLDFGYAITVHKSQGATFKHVFYNSTTSGIAKGVMTENGVQVGFESDALDYVGMSRASETLTVLYDEKRSKKFKSQSNQEEQRNALKEDSPKEEITLESLLDSGMFTQVSGYEDESPRGQDTPFDVGRAIFQNQETISDKRMLQAIVKMDGKYAPLAQRLMAFQGSSIPVTMVKDVSPYTTSEDPENVLGVYNSTHHGIFIKEGALDNRELAQEVLVHEVLHGYSTYFLYNKNLNVRDRATVSKFQDIYEAAKKYDYSFSNKYFISSPTEFFVGVFTNEAFINEMSLLPPLETSINTSLWQDLVDIVMDMFNIPQESKSLLDDALRVSSEILGQNEQYEMEMKAREAAIDEMLLEQMFSEAQPEERLPEIKKCK